MADHLGRDQAPQLCAAGQGRALAEAPQEAGRVHVARAGGVHDMLDSDRGDLHHRRALGHDRAPGAAGDNHRRGHLGRAVAGRDRIAGRLQGAYFGLVGEHDIDTVLDQVQPFVAVALHAVGVAQRQGHGPAGVARGLHGQPDGVLGHLHIPEIALAVGDAGRGHHARVHIGGPQQGRSAQKGVHGPLGVWGHLDQAAGRRRAVRRGRHVEGDARSPDVVHEHLAQLVVSHLADEAGPAAEGGHPGHGVGRRSAGGRDPGRHGVVEVCGPAGADQGHGPLHQAVVFDERLVHRRDHIDDGVADTHNIENRFQGASSRLAPDSRPVRVVSS